MQHHKTYQPRLSTKKQNTCKPKMVATERQKRIVRKKLLKLFSSWKTLHLLYNKIEIKSHSAQTGSECKVKPKTISRDNVTLTKKNSVVQREYRGLRV